MNIDVRRKAAPPHRHGTRIATWIATGLVALLPLAAMAQTTKAPLLNEHAPKRIPGQYIVVFKQGVAGKSVQASQDRMRALGGKIGYTYNTALRGFSAALSDNAVARLRENPEVAYIEVDQVGDLNVVQNNPPAGLDRTSERLLPLDLRYTYSETGNNVHVYVIDTGIRPTHNEMVGRVSGGTNTMNLAAGTGDCHGHGTHVAGTIGGTTFGIAKQALLHPVRAGDCFNTYLAPVIAAVDWVTANRVLPAVANLSSGFSPSPTLDTAIANSVASGVTYSVAAGNNNGDACNISPARAPTAITVGAINPTNDTRANFSNWGTCVDLFAPGVNTLSAGIANDASTAVMSGTSMAAPHVAGVAARYLQIHPASTPAAVWAALHNANNTPATPGWAGVINRGAGSPNEQLHYGSLNDGVDDGDPHITTVNGLHYDFQPGGEFVALLGNMGMEIQTRQTVVPSAPWVSVNTAIAARVGSYRVTWVPNLSGVPDPSGLQLRVNGSLVSPGPGGIALGVGGRLSKYGSNGIQVDFPDGTTLIATSNWWSNQSQWYINVRVYHTPATEGLMGVLTSGEWNRPGFVDSWRVTDKTTLFDYAKEDSTGNYRKDPFPEDKIPPMKPENVELARRVCEPLQDRRIRANCEFDVGTTGDDIFAKSSQESQAVQNGGTKTSLGANGKEDAVVLTASVSRLARGQSAPTGAARLLVDGKDIAEAARLDKNGVARWTLSAEAIKGQSVVAEYVPAKDSGFLGSTSGALEYGREAKRAGDPLADPVYRRLSK
ncbi:S8 family serine peptidase [Lysobacter silvisoli]|nr:S8 family serine peptidase [Lysobacter silvisoli]